MPADVDSPDTILPLEVERCLGPDHPGWLELRDALWPQAHAVHRDEMRRMAHQPTRFASFVALSAEAMPVGFAEAALRGDYVNGTSSSPVAYLEGIYVVPSARRRGVARQLVAAVERWGRELGCREFASDALLDNLESHAFHRALGFAETDRVVYFVREIP
jgi:aminoglycoside 6'-N-acetyltransferase I